MAKSKSKGPSIDDIVELYEGHGKVFENVFTGDTELIEAFLAWGKATHPHWYEEAGTSHGPGTRAVLLEILIYDEENEAESVAPFFQQLPDALRDRALNRLREYAEESDAHDAAAAGDD